MSYPLLRALALPLWIAFALAALAAAPALAVIARLLGAVTRRPEPVALVRLLYVYVTGELAMLASWPTHAERVRGLSRFLDDLVVSALGSLNVNVEVVGEPAALRALERHERPLLVLGRHAGAGDSVLIVHLLLSRYGREPGIVMKELLTLDPVVGMVARHLPSALIDGGEEDRDEIFDLAAGLKPDAALVLFPEGGNFTPDRRRKAIDWLRRHQPERAAWAQRLEHVMAPRPGGVLAAMAGARGADVILVAHEGLGYREIPRDKTLTFRLWHVPAEELPVDDEGRSAWLDRWWSRMDDWVATQGG